MNIQTIQTPEATVTVTTGLPAVSKAHLETEGNTTVLRVGGLEIVVDPDHNQAEA